jgi:hypothetical protein
VARSSYCRQQAAGSKPLCDSRKQSAECVDDDGDVDRFLEQRPTTGVIKPAAANTIATSERPMPAIML